MASKSALGAILRALKTGFGADFGFEAFLDQFWSRFGSIFDPRNLKNQGSRVEGLHFFEKSRFLKKDLENNAPDPPGGAKMDAKIDPQAAPYGGQRTPKSLLGAPGRVP